MSKEGPSNHQIDHQRDICERKQQGEPSTEASLQKGKEKQVEIPGTTPSRIMTRTEDTNQVSNLKFRNFQVLGSFPPRKNTPVKNGLMILQRLCEGNDLLSLGDNGGGTILAQ